MERMTFEAPETPDPENEPREYQRSHLETEPGRELTPPPPAGDMVIDAATGEIVELPQAAVTLFGSSEPREVLRRAKAHADVLADVIAQRKLFIVRNEKAYVLVDAWTLLGSMVGVYPIVVDVEPVEVFGVQGFRATVEAVTRDGAMVSRASAYCLRDENLWSLNPTGKGGRKLEPRDLHAVASMAQTRATSKALKQALGFIVQLAGYQTTPAEEMPAAA